MLVILILTIYLVFQTHARSVYVSFFIVILMLLINYIKPKWVYYSFFLSLGGGLLFLLLYIILPGSELGNLFNTLSLKLFRKSFFSGREGIWNELWTHIAEAPILGHGISTDPNYIESIGTSAHNQYLQIILESGFLGISLFIIFLYQLWLLLRKNQNHFTGMLSSAYLIAFIFYETFEVTLFQNNFNIGLIQWLIITMGVKIIDPKKDGDCTKRTSIK
ncbi:O-antigen ligase family protein [Halolactibacillus miurensis]|nr:O-antigen ligase family protein [Halolactibacillus miurensis]